jgi:small subunit ribosomal protein S17
MSTDMTQTAAVDALVRGRRKVREGVVVSDKMERTVVVVIQELKPHPLYKKVVRSTTKLKVHNENDDAHVGDRVRIVETRPLSKDKRWRVDEVIERAK